MYWQPLIDEADREIFQRNGFRILRLSSVANSREIARAAQLRDQICTGDGNRISLVDFPVDKPAIQRAYHRLQDPFLRVVDEIFWFWPDYSGEPQGDEPSLLVVRGQVQEAHDLWRQWESDFLGQGATRSLVAIHNLGVLYLCMACEWELKLITRQATVLSAPVKEHVEQLWGEALSRWAIIFEEKHFNAGLRNYLLARLGRLGERQLRPENEVVAQVCEALPLAIALIAADVAAQLARGGFRKEVQSLADILRRCGLERAVLTEAFRRVLRRERALLHEVCQMYKERAAALPREGLSCGRSLLQETREVLNTLELFLGADDPLFIQCSDEVALAALGCQVAYGNTYEDWQTSLEFLQEVSSLPRGGEAREKISENIRIVQKNVESGQAWAGPGYWTLPPELLAIAEQARDLYKQGDYESAAGILRRIIGHLPMSSLRLLPPDHPVRVISRCLSTVVYEKAVRDLKQAIEEYSRPLPLVQQIINNTLRAAFAAAALDSGLCVICAVCSAQVHGEFVVCESHNLRFPLCSFHGGELKRQVSERERRLGRAVQTAYEDLCQAVALCPENKLAHKALDDVREIAEKNGIKLKSTPAAKAAGLTPVPAGKSDSQSAETSPPESRPECFIATAAYGTPLHHDIDCLRDFRDRVLARSSLGRKLIAWYYRHSPPIAAWVRRSPLAAAIVRGAIRCFLAVWRSRKIGRGSVWRKDTENSSTS